MKRIFIITVFLLVVASVFPIYAQDLIILRDGNVIEARVIEISPTEIRYRRINHLDGPVIVILRTDVLSIRYENGMIEIINTVIEPTVTTPNILTIPTAVQIGNQPDRNPRLNTIGATLGYQGVSAFGITVIGTVSPANYTFFDFSLGLGFNSFAFNGRINFNAFVPFSIGGWYAGIGIGGGYNELFGGIFAGNITTGFIFFNWLNIAYSLQFGNFNNIVNHNVAVGYSFRFNSQQETVANIAETQGQPPVSVTPVIVTPPRTIRSYTVVNVIGSVQRGSEGRWVDVRAGDTVNDETLVRTATDSLLIITDGNINYTIQSGVFNRVGDLINRLR